MLADWQVLWNVPWSCFTVQCQGYGASHKSALIVAPSKLHLTARNSCWRGIVDMFSLTSMPSTLFSLKPSHSNGKCWKDFDCLLKYLMHTKYLRHCSWCGNNTHTFPHSWLIKQNKTNGASGKKWKRKTLFFSVDSLILILDEFLYFVKVRVYKSTVFCTRPSAFRHFNEWLIESFINETTVKWSAWFCPVVFKRITGKIQYLLCQHLGSI